MTWLAARTAEVRLALLLLTRLPAGRLAEPVPPIAAARWAFPLAGAVVGLLTWAVHAGALALGVPAGAAAVLALAAGALVTGGLHLDGLADLADGAGGGRDRARRLEIMRDSRIGSHGAAALILALALSGSALAALGPAATCGAFVAVGAASRLVMVILLASLPPARADGLGQSAAASGADARLWAAAGIAAFLCALAPAPLAMLVAAGAAALAVGLLARQTLGGQTGDVLGAAQVLAEAAAWTALAAAAGGT